MLVWGLSRQRVTLVDLSQESTREKLSEPGGRGEWRGRESGQEEHPAGLCRPTFLWWEPQAVTSPGVTGSDPRALVHRLWSMSAVWRAVPESKPRGLGGALESWTRA